MLRSLAAVSFVLCPLTAFAADGDVDLSFGGGQVTITRPTEFPTGPTPTGDVLGLADGAYLWIMANQDSTVWIGRTLHDGSADTAFGTDGTGRVALDDCIDFTPTFLADDGAGGAYAWTGACIVHVEPDGSLEAGFGGVPLVGTDYYVIDFARDASGRFVFAATTGQTWDVLRFESDGVTPDATFGTAGHVRIDVGATNNLRGVNALALRGDGRIVTAGWRGNDHGPNLVVAELTESGVLDPGWNGGAVVDLDAPSGQPGIEATALAIDADGSVVVGGFEASGMQTCCLLLTRLDASGAIVGDFGLREYQLSDDTTLGSFFEGRDAVTIRGDGSIVLATTAFPFSGNHRTQFVLTKTDANGVLDTSFGNGGWRGYTIADPDGVGQTGDYDQLHAIVARDDSVLVFGRTFFEDNSNGLDYVSMVRATFAAPDQIFASSFDG
ncbi:MAG TPA: hypothetical protein VFV97_08180 [Rhodanobacteraceae bacterium]|nr:hypothetical protein [Rhodanobacteraceae bacterium]